ACRRRSRRCTPAPTTASCARARSRTSGPPASPGPPRLPSSVRFCCPIPSRRRRLRSSAPAAHLTRGQLADLVEASAVVPQDLALVLVGEGQLQEVVDRLRVGRI